MLKKTLIALGLLAATTLSGCVVATPRPYAYRDRGYYYDDTVVVEPIVPVYGWWYGGWYRGGYHGWHGGRGGYHRR